MRDGTRPSDIRPGLQLVALVYRQLNLTFLMFVAYMLLI